MTDISDLLVCHECKNVFTNKVAGVRSLPTVCPVCKTTSSSRINSDSV